MRPRKYSQFFSEDLLTTVTDLGYIDYSEYFVQFQSYKLAQKGSENVEMFLKIEPYLTSLNVHQLEREGADLLTRVEELEQLNQ